ncbi:hypothetical protein M8C21_027897 [Ambrosia artemisiifolia]|uniref:Transmembrane protein n=1 Tax=Ambrosia artemisiifolia TaxID=4212 RepID=A0AAD5GQ80_AMBAR|nr:hypothetical protein M8C21_027897 [Ambrosia artemisiifolia]
MEKKGMVVLIFISTFLLIISSVSSNANPPKYGAAHGIPSRRPPMNKGSTPPPSSKPPCGAGIHAICPGVPNFRAAHGTHSPRPPKRND